MAEYMHLPQDDSDQESTIFELSEIPNKNITSKEEHTQQIDDCNSPEMAGIQAMTARQTWKNICVVATVFILLFMAYNGLVDLQSSLFIDAGMGVTTQSVLYAAYSFSCLFCPKLLISLIGHKWSITASICGYITWLAANGYATWVTMTVTSVFVGISAAPLWTAQRTYVAALAESYAINNKKQIESTITLFYGVFTALFKLSAVFGNAISWFILKGEKSLQDTRNVSDNRGVCGAEDCPWTNSTNTHYHRVPDPILWTLVGTFLLLGVTSLLLAIFCLDTLPHNALKKPRMSRVDVITSLTGVLRQLKDVRLLLLIPIDMFGGLSLTFIWADFNKSYVTCAIGIWMVGLVFLPSVVADGITCFLVGYYAKYINRVYVFMAAALIDAIVLFLLLFWEPHENQVWMFFMVPLMMGIAGGAMHVQFISMVAVTFDDQESAFSALSLWGTLSTATAFGINKLLCVKYKIYINFVCLVLWIVGYLLFEKIVTSRKRYNNQIKSY